MRPKDFITDSVFQLNLLIWMAIEQPPEHFRVRPLFYEGGFELFSIEQPFPFPVVAGQRIVAAAKKAGLTVSIKPEPDLVLRRMGGNEVLYFEAKLSSHSASSSTAKQTRGHLLAGAVFGEVYSGLDQCLVVYVVSHSTQAQMKKCLDELVQQLTALGLKSGNGVSDGLSVEDGTVHYHLDPATAQTLKTSVAKVPVIEGLDEETDPTPLLLVYSDEDCRDNSRKDFYRTALQNQVLARLVSDLHRAPIKTDFRVSAKGLLIRTSSNVFEYVGKDRQKSMEKLVVQNIFWVINQEWAKRTPKIVRITSGEIIFNFWDEDHKERLLDWLENAKKTNFPSGKPSPSTHAELFPAESIASIKKPDSV